MTPMNLTKATALAALAALTIGTGASAQETQQAPAAPAVKAESFQEWELFCPEPNAAAEVRVCEIRTLMSGEGGKKLVASADIIAPVPLHRWRLVRRRYNQAAVLANAIAALRGKRVVPDLLVRRRATPSQGHLGRSQRRRNVAGAFALHPGRAHSAVGARILLVDDVLTTGATAEACAKALRNAGAKAVDLLVLARVIRVQPG